MVDYAVHFYETKKTAQIGRWLCVHAKNAVSCDFDNDNKRRDSGACIICVFVWKALFKF